MSYSQEAGDKKIESFDYEYSEQRNFEVKFAVENTQQLEAFVDQHVERMANTQPTNASKIPQPGFSRKQLTPFYEKTKLLRTVLERQVTRKLDHSSEPWSAKVGDHSRIPKPPQTAHRQLNFSIMDESRVPSLQERSDPSLGILQPEEMDLGSFRVSIDDSGRHNSSNLSDGILRDSQMICNSFETSYNGIDTDYLLKRLQDQIILHNTLLDASEKFPKSPSIENLVKQCMRGTDALTALKQRVARYKTAKQSARKSHPNAGLLQELPNIIRHTINCAEDLQKLAEEIVHVSASSFDSNILNRSSLTSKSIKDTTNRLKEIEQMWQHMPTPEEEGSSLGLLHESEMRGSGHFLNDVSASLNTVFEEVNHSLEEVLQTPNTQSLNSLKTHLKECQKLLSDIALNNSLLNEESMPSFAESSDVHEVPLLNIVCDELDKSWKSEIEAFLDIWKSPEKERFLQISKQTIDDLSFLRQETNHMLGKMKISDRSKQPSTRRQHLIERLNVLRGTEQPGHRPTYTSIIMKDYIDEDDLCAEQECLPKAESSKRTVQFTDRSNGTVKPAKKLHAQKPNLRTDMVEARLEILLQEMDQFQQNYLTSNNQEGKQSNSTIIENKIDGLMAMISELVGTLRSN